MRPPATGGHPPRISPLAILVILLFACSNGADARAHYGLYQLHHHAHGRSRTRHPHADHISRPPSPGTPPEEFAPDAEPPPLSPADVPPSPSRQRRPEPLPRSPAAESPSHSPAVPTSPSPAVSQSILPAKPPSSSPAEPPSLLPAKRPALSPTKPPSFFPTKRRSHFPAKPPSLSPAMSPSFSSAEPPSSSPAKPPSYLPAEPPPFSPAKPPSHLPARSTSLSPAKPPPLSPANPPSLSPAKPPSLPPANPPSHLPAKPPTPSLSPANPPSHLPAKPTSLSPAKPPSLSPAKPPSLSPAKPPSQLPAKPPPFSPAKPPSSSPAKPPPHLPAKAPSSSPAMPPSSSPAKLPPHLPAKPPSSSPAMPPSLSPAKPPALSPAKPPALSPTPHYPAKQSPPPPAVSPAEPPVKNSTCGGNSSSSSCVFDVRAFGAAGDGASDDARAFRAAWKAACSAASGAVLLVPSDGVFMVTSTIFAGPCQPGLVFQIDGVLMPPDGPNRWPEAGSRRQWLVFYKADGMTLRGKGTVEGNGEEWWNLPCKPHKGPNGSTLPGPCDSPALIRFFLSSNVTVRDLRIENSPQFHLKFDGCDGVLVDGLSVSSPAFSPNTDGIHIENTRSVEIYNSRISNGDDCISIGTGCSHVHIENVTCGPGHGISIGSLGASNSRACVSNVTVRNSRVRESDNGLRIKTWQGGAGSVSGVTFEGVQMERVRNCIVVDQYYCPAGRGRCANLTSAVRVADVAYADIRGTYDSRAGTPVRFACSDAVACTGITMTDVQLLPDGGGAGAAVLAEPYCWNAYGVMQTLTLPPVYCLQDGRPQSLQDQITTNC